MRQPGSRALLVLLLVPLALWPAGPSAGAVPVALTPPPNLTVEATSAEGAVVTFQVPDDSGGQAVCAPAAESVFPLGTTTVTCTAGAAQASFTVTVVDTKPPVLTQVPRTVVLRVNGLRTSVVKYEPPVARDVVDGVVPVSCSPSAKTRFSLGTTEVFCKASDTRRNVAKVSFLVRVLDTVPPPRPTDVIASSRATSIGLFWRQQQSTDVAGAQVVKYPGGTQIYRGGATSFTDVDVHVNGSYRYVVRAYDWAGNLSRPAVVKAAARATGLLRPQDKARLTRPPLLVWQSVTGASYYNVQLWSTGPGGNKLLTIWPRTNHLQLTAAWTFQGEMHTFTTGKYVWYVWPGFGLLATGKYGKLLGSSTFVVG